MHSHPFTQAHKDSFKINKKALKLINISLFLTVSLPNLLISVCFLLYLFPLNYHASYNNRYLPFLLGHSRCTDIESSQKKIQHREKTEA
jgi:hypothetical protein